MELPLVNVSTCELRFVIRFFTTKNETAVNIHRNLVTVYGEGCMSIQMVRRWRSWFLEGRQNLYDDERSGRPVTATDNAAVAAVRNVMEADRRVTINEIMIRLPPGIEIGRSSIGTIMLDVLNFRKVCAIWFPPFLEIHRRDGDQLFSPIVTGDESWVHQSTAETKRQSMVWKKPEEGVPKKAKFTISAGKVMAIAFWDCKGVFFIDYLSPNTTVNAARYCEVLTKLRTAIKRKHPGPWSRKVLLVHDNARPHAARTTQTLLENFKWEIFTHPSYSPELAPSDFHLFPALKLHLGGNLFANDDEVQAEANHWLRRQDTAWYNSGIKKLLQRQIEIKKNAYITPNGIYEFQVMPFGLCNAPATFERMMDKILKELNYLNDIVLPLNIKKCIFGTKLIRVFGHLSYDNGIYPDPENIEAIAKFPTPR
ncbi:hypothetical protein LAZ67_2005934 [Cordylochernes scorpioides]|uniref:Mos1 transposase HTH domain-containing protein n=1 Tax=Cordylochernes scorpioides TaxID=51811 RepID=A0ABY6K5S8_9ARAC|nr:hypothetical protein LAZ67_2005934 [Cordylochernes scorpioides]